MGVSHLRLAKQIRTKEIRGKNVGTAAILSEFYPRLNKQLLDVFCGILTTIDVYDPLILDLDKYVVMNTTG